jgi:signal transduction histidine kinase
MQTRSLAFRLTVSSAIVACVMLLAAALLLNQLFQQALERNFDARLRAVLDGVLASVELGEDGSPRLPAPLADTRFTIPLSGWYWQIKPVDVAGAKDLASASLLEKRLDIPPNAIARRGTDGVADFYLTDSAGKQLRAVEQRFELFDTGKDYSFLVAGNFDELKAEVAAFRNFLYTILSLLGLGLLAAILVQVRFGLRPMQDMEQKLNDIRSGKATLLEGNFPAEMQPVADEINLLMKANAGIVDRAHMQVGNLAHALKTPLAVLTNEADANKSQIATVVGTQVKVMRDQVDHYLDRARRATRAQNLGANCEVEPVLQALARTLARINRDKTIDIAITVAPGLRFRGDQQDLEEMVGNLMDNACKWANSRVVLAAKPDGQFVSGRPRLLISVEDNGPGIAAENRQRALKRGQRLDEKTPGSGLGLSIVAETASLYEGLLELADAGIGGLKSNLWLPMVPR